jgi:hypothetical protein
VGKLIYTPRLIEALQDSAIDDSRYARIERGLRKLGVDLEAGRRDREQERLVDRLSSTVANHLPK